MHVNPDIKPLVIQCKKMFHQGQTWESVLRFLKEETGSPILSIQVIAEIFSIPQEAAKCIIHYSDTWKSWRQVIEDLHETAIEAGDSLTGKKVPKSNPD